MILVGTPAYNGMVHIDYVNTIINMEKEHSLTLMCLGNESLITRGRNTIISYFYKCLDNFTHLLFIDGDVGVPPGVLTRMLNCNVDVLGVPVPLKGYHQGKRIYNFAGILEHVDDNLMKVDVIGTALFLISKKTVIDIVSKSKMYVKDFNGMNCENYEVFKTGVHNGIYYSEDFFLCKDLREIGYDIYALKNVYVRHNGVCCFD